MKNERSLKGRTELLYEMDSYMKEFDANVIRCIPFSLLERNKELKLTNTDEYYAVELDQSAFFPEGGGQKSDSGFLDEIEVIDVFKENGCIYHLVKENLIVGKQVHGKIDFQKRYRNMQNHSGEHLVCGLIHSLFGYENVGFHLTDQLITVDVNGVLTTEDFILIEEKTNQAIYENKSIYVVFPEKEDELDYRSKLDLEEDIRVVIIDDYDACACCAPHLKSTAEIGLIKILDFMSHRGGTRFTLQCGQSAFETYQNIFKQNKEMMSLLSAKRESCLDAVKRQAEQLKNAHIQEVNLKKEISSLYMEKVKIDPIFFTDSLDDVQIRNIINETTKTDHQLVAAFMKQPHNTYRYIIGKKETANIDLKLLAKDLQQKFNSRGGGSDKMIQGSISASAEEISAYLKNYL